MLPSAKMARSDSHSSVHVFAPRLEIVASVSENFSGVSIRRLLVAGSSLKGFKRGCPLDALALPCMRAHVHVHAHACARACARTCALMRIHYSSSAFVALLPGLLRCLCRLLLPFSTFTACIDFYCLCRLSLPLFYFAVAGDQTKSGKLFMDVAT